MKLRLSSWRATYLLVLPTLAVLGSWASLSFPSPGGAYAYRLVGFIAVFPLLIAWISGRSKLDSSGKWLLAVAAIAGLWGLVSQFWANQPTVAVSEAIVTSIAAFIAFSYLLAAMQIRDGTANAWRGLAIAAVPLWALGLLQMQSGIALTERIGGTWIYGDYLGGPFSNPNNYAVYLVACTVPFVASVFYSDGVTKKVASIAAVMASAYLIDQTGSRSGLILLAAVVALIVLSKLIGRMGTYLVVCGVVGSVIAVIGRLVWASSDTLLADYIASGEQASDQLRLTLTKRGAAYFQESAGFGIGPGHFESRASEDGFVVTNAHNTFVEVLAEFGFPLTLAMLGGAVSVVAFWWRSNRTEKFRQDRLGMGVTFALIVVVIASGLVTSSALAEPIWWVLISVIVISVTSSRDALEVARLKVSTGASSDLR